MCEHGGLGETGGAACELEVADQVRKNLPLSKMELLGADFGSLREHVAVCGAALCLTPDYDDLGSPSDSCGQLAEKGAVVKSPYPLCGEKNLAFYSLEVSR